MRRMLAHLAMLLTAGAALANDFDDHKAVRVRVETAGELNALLGLTDDVWSHRIGIGGDVDVRLTPEAYEVLVDLGLAHQVLIDDIGAAIDAERLEIQQRNLLAGLDFYENYHEADDIEAYVDDLIGAHPGIAEKFVIGQSIEGRDIWGVRVTGFGDPGDRPDIAFNGCQHAREWVSPATVVYILEHLITGYDVDPDITQVMDNLEFHIVPIINQDGYRYSWADPDNRLWRKNRRDNPGPCFGVDLNRNWSFGWGGQGASGDECNDLYRGPSPLSEPESTAWADYMSGLENLVAHIDYHSYGQLILSPWGYTAELPANHSLFECLNEEIQQSIFDDAGELYTTGPLYDTLYPASGVEPDFVFGELGALSWTIELRPEGQGGGGFILPPDQIVPTGQENLPGFIAMAKSALVPVKIVPTFTIPNFVGSGETVGVSVDVYEVTEAPTDVTLMVAEDDDFVAIAMSPEGDFGWSAEFAAGGCGETAAFFVEVTTDGGQSATWPEAGADDPVSIDIVEAVNLFADDMEDDLGWTVGDVDDDATTGIWERADPQGTQAQPGDDHTPDGTLCYVTGASANGGLGGNDIDGGKTTLFSPVFSAAGDDVHVSYWRWYSNDQGASPNNDEMPVSISNDAGDTWTTLEVVDENAGDWVFASFRVADFVEPTDQMQIRFVASDEGDGSVVEAAVDDFSVDSFGCECPAGADFNGDGELSILDFVAYQAAFVMQDPCADINGDGAFDILDFVAFQVLFQGG